jgi:hypothetical protein
MKVIYESREELPEITRQVNELIKKSFGIFGFLYSGNNHIILCFDCWLNSKVTQKDEIEEEFLTSLEYHEEEGRLGIL